MFPITKYLLYFLTPNWFVEYMSQPSTETLEEDTNKDLYNQSLSEDDTDYTEDDNSDELITPKRTYKDVLTQEKKIPYNLRSLKQKQQLK